MPTLLSTPLIPASTKPEKLAGLMDRYLRLDRDDALISRLHMLFVSDETTAS